MPHRLLLVDGHAYAYRAFHAIRSLNAPDGSPTNAIFGFIKMLQKMDASLKPSHRLVIWDGGLAAERLEILPDYKAQRPSMPADLSLQLTQIEGWLEAAGWASLQREGMEADDWIGTYAHRAAAAGWETVIASSDKDFMQLVSPLIGLLNPNDKTERIWTAEDVRGKAGVGPELIVDWLALIGDAVDNIPGVPGVGPKTATELLLRFGSAEGVLGRLMEVKQDKLRANLLGAVEAVRRNQKMIRLHTTLEDGPALEALVPGVPRVAPLREMYRRWNFRSLLAELGEEGGGIQGDLAL
jgi:DNA polymerase-1